jgi:hypothetical protein
VHLYIHSPKRLHGVVLNSLSTGINLPFFFTFTEFTNIFRNEILRVQCTTHEAVIPLYKLTGRFKS